MYDYIIIGGGLAGSTLGYRLIKEGAKVMVLDEPSKNMSSNVAAGIVNPITGKRMVLTWKADELFDELHTFYPTLERDMGAKFFYTKPLYRIFDSVFEQNEWLNKQNELGFYEFAETNIYNLDSKLLNNPYGVLQILKAGRLDIKLYIQNLHQWLKSNDAISFQNFDYSRVVVSAGAIEYNEIKAKALIFCDGTSMSANPFFNCLPHKPVHGEILEVEIIDFYQDRIINKGIYILPLGKQNYMVGATYNWDLKEPIITSEGKEYLEARLKALIGNNYKITGHTAGIRPSTNDRRPFLGRHPQHNNIFVFGGFGSKGASLVPFLSKVFIKFLMYDVELPAEVDICRVL